jgi:hypothetical protein
MKILMVLLAVVVVVGAIYYGFEDAAVPELKRMYPTLTLTEAQKIAEQCPSVWLPSLAEMKNVSECRRLAAERFLE